MGEGGKREEQEEKEQEEKEQEEQEEEEQQEEEQEEEKYECLCFNLYLSIFIKSTEFFIRSITSSWIY